MGASSSQPTPPTSTISPALLTNLASGAPSSGAGDMATWRTENVKAQAFLDAQINKTTTHFATVSENIGARVAKMEGIVKSNPSLSGETPCLEIQRKLVSAMSAKTDMETVQICANNLRVCVRESLAA